MILIEITDETGVTHYEVLGLSREELAGLDEKGLAKKVGTTANKKKRDHIKIAQRGNAQAAELLERINIAETTLKDKKKLAEYDKGLETGKDGLLEILRIRPIASPFFWDRQVRFRVIERMMREAGLLRSIPFDQV